MYAHILAKVFLCHNCTNPNKQLLSVNIAENAWKQAPGARLTAWDIMLICGRVWSGVNRCSLGLRSNTHAPPTLFASSGNYQPGHLYSYVDYRYYSYICTKRVLRQNFSTAFIDNWVVINRKPMCFRLMVFLPLWELAGEMICPLRDSWSFYREVSLSLTSTQ